MPESLSNQHPLVLRNGENKVSFLHCVKSNFVHLSYWPQWCSLPTAVKGSQKQVENLNFLIAIRWRSNLTFWNRKLAVQNSIKWLSLGSLRLCWNIEIRARPKVNKIVWHIKLYDGWQQIVQYCFILSNILFPCKGQEIKEQFYSSLPACAG